MTPPLDDHAAAAREVAWVAREADRLVHAVPPAPAVEWAEFYERKARLLRYIAAAGEPEAEALAVRAETMALEYRDEDEPLPALDGT